MKLPRLSFWVALGLLISVGSLTAAPAKPKASTSNTTVPFERTKSRIDALLSRRLKPAPLPEVLPNPFQLAEAPAAPTQEKDPKANETLGPVSDSEMLVYYGAMLRISGTVRIEDQTHLIINQAPYKEGDIFNLKTKEVNAKLRIISIAPGELTLGLNAATQVIKFKK